MNYDATTTNGIKYISRLYANSYKYQMVVDDLDTLAVTRKDILAGGGVSGYTIGSRSITKNVLSAEDVLKKFDKLMAQKLQLEKGIGPRKAVAVIPRDW